MCKKPVSGMPDFVTITEQQEIEMGRAYHKEILKTNKVLDNKELNKYFVKLGKRLLNQVIDLILIGNLPSLTIQPLMHLPHQGLCLLLQGLLATLILKLN